MGRANSLTYAMIATGCILAPLIVVGTGLRDAEVARQKMIRERAEFSRFLMGCVRHQQIHTCRVLHRMTHEQRHGDDPGLAGSLVVAGP